MDIQGLLRLQMTRRQLFGRAANGVGVAALASLLAPEGLLAANNAINSKSGGLAGLPHFPPKANRVIFLFQYGGPSQMDLFDYKPRLQDLQGTNCRIQFSGRALRD